MLKVIVELFAYHLLYRDVRMSRAQDAQERPHPNLPPKRGKGP